MSETVIPSTQTEAKKKRGLLPIFIVVFVDLLGFSIILPLLPYYAKSFAASPQLVGFLVATYSFCQFIAAPLLGQLSDRYGRRPLMFYSQVGSFLGFVLLGFAMHLPLPLFWLFTARVIDGFSGGNITIAQAYVSDVTAPEERAKSFGMIIGVSFGLGFLLGPALGGFLSRFGYDVPAYVAACFSFISMMMTYFLLPETQHQRDEERKFGLKSYTRIFDYIKEASLRRLLVIFFFFTLPFALYVSMFALYADHQLNFTAEQAGYFLATVGLMGIFWQGGVVGPLVKNLGERKSLIAGLISSVIGLFGLLLVDVWWKLLIVAFFFSFGTGVTRPSLTSLITQAAPPNRRGGVLGVTSSIESFTRIIAPIMGGWIIGSLHPSWLGLFGGAFASIGVIVALGLTD